MPPSRRRRRPRRWLEDAPASATTGKASSRSAKSPTCREPGRLWGVLLILEVHPLRPRAVADRRAAATARGRCTRWSRTTTSRASWCARRSPYSRTAGLDEASAAAMRRVLEELDYVGVLAVEFFQRGEELIANEMAPRVHNSGHWTIEA
ncbi:MAG: ATP-grasp domain-containing protein [Gemmataceae bacterium]